MDETDLPAVELSRVLTVTQADALIGERVPVRDPEPGHRDGFRVLDADTGALVAVYARTPGNTPALRRAVLNLEWSETLRGGSGIRNRSRTFGYAPRKPVLRREGCQATALAGDQPAEHIVIADLALELDSALVRFAPHEAKSLHDTPVGTDWRLNGSGWTSGVVNYTSTLPYHRDRSNFDAWSAMPAVRRAVAGGHLDLPEYGVTLPVRDGFCLWFNGHRLVHGVTPMRKTRPDGYRVTVVYYCLRGMKDCATYAAESARAADKRTERERRIAARIDAGEPLGEWLKPQPVMDVPAEFSDDLAGE